MSGVPVVLGLDFGGTKISMAVSEPTGERIEFGGVREVVVERPDRLRFDVIDRDGETLTLRVRLSDTLGTPPDPQARVILEP